MKNTNGTKMQEKCKCDKKLTREGMIGREESKTV